MKFFALIALVGAAAAVRLTHSEPHQLAHHRAEAHLPIHDLVKITIGNG